jgi:hypothetical protein
MVRATFEKPEALMRNIVTQLLIIVPRRTALGG